MTTEAVPRSGPGRPGAARSTSPPLAGAGGRRPDLFGRLLILLVFTYLLSAFTDAALVSAVQVVLFLGVVLLSLRTGRLRRRTVRITAIVLLAGTVAAVTLVATDKDGPGGGVANMWTALVLLLSAVLIIRRVLSQPDITLQSIYGAISAYMILGLMFAAVYAGLSHFGGTAHPFFAHNELPSTQHFQYFSFTTLTTLGYGDYTAAQSQGQAIAVIEAMAGQIFLATLVARLVAGYRGASRAVAMSPSLQERSEPPRGPRAHSRRASAPGLTRLRPPGASRRRAADPVRPSSSPGRASRARR
jgi:hypothetical protein